MDYTIILWLLAGLLYSQDWRTNENTGLGLHPFNFIAMPFADAAVKVEPTKLPLVSLR